MTRYGIIGLERGTVRLIPHQREWRVLFHTEIRRLQRVLASLNLTLEFHHTGSTAIAGMPAKPIIDILAGRRPGEPREPYVLAIEAAGYQYRGEQGIAGRDFFRRGDPSSYHLHVTEVGSTFWADHLDFRNYLRAHPAAAAEYALLKTQLAVRHPRDRGAYINGKTAFVSGILAQARTPVQGTRPLGSKP